MVAVLNKLGHDGLLTNRVSKTIKEQMRDTYGYTFEWCGHDARPDDKTCMLTHYLEYFYVMPVIRMDQGFLGQQISTYSRQFWS